MTVPGRARDSCLLAALWLVVTIHDVAWLALDRQVPDWDQSKYLTAALDYEQVLRQPAWLSGAWWSRFWHVPSKAPPLAAVATVPFFRLLGTGPDQAMGLQLACSALLICIVYQLGRTLFSRRVGLEASVLCALLPSLAAARLRYTLDYPLAAATALAFWRLTVWGRGWSARREAHDATGWGQAALAGLTVGVAALVKQQAAFFLAVPLLWLTASAWRSRDWRIAAQAVLVLVIAGLLCWPWYVGNWLTIISSGWRATVIAARRGGQPALWSLAGWTAYLRAVPVLLSWVVTASAAIAGVAARRWPAPSVSDSEQSDHRRRGPANRPLVWLGVVLAGSYVVASLSPNRQARYLIPAVPIASVVIAWAFWRVRDPWGRRLRWGTMGLLAATAAVTLWPLFGAAGLAVAGALSPGSLCRAYTGPEWPHRDLIDHVIRRAPYEQSTIAVLSWEPRLNHDNVNLFGALRDRQVYGREAGANASRVTGDLRSHTWFLTRTTDSVPAMREAAAVMASQVERSFDLVLDATWRDPEGKRIRLFRRRLPAVDVTLLPDSSGAMRLAQVIVPDRTPPGVPVPVTYVWNGPWDELANSVAVITWRRTDTPESPATRWLHDHAVAFGRLFGRSSSAAGSFQVVERTAMLPPHHVAPGVYTLGVASLDRRTGRWTAVRAPEVRLEIRPDAKLHDAPELDLVTQLRMLGTQLPQGPRAIRSLFEEIARIDQYDPVQDFFVQTDVALTWRLEREPTNVEWAYARLLARALQQQTGPTREAMTQVLAVDAANPYASALAAVVELSDLRPRAAATHLDRALALGATDPEILGMSALAGLMQGRVVRAWRDGLKALTPLR